MDEFERGAVFVRVRDLSGEEFVCPWKALKNPQDLSPDERERCVDSAAVGRYPGDIQIAGDKTDKKENSI
jgi:hypothetical protein